MNRPDAVYAVGDVHGQLDLLRKAHRMIEADGGPAARIVHLGDLIDKGPDSRGVVEYLMRGQAGGRDWMSVRGNHDNKLPRFINDPGWVDPGSRSGKTWLGDRGNGSAQTLASYGIMDACDRPVAEVHAQALRVIPTAHVQWLDRLPPWILHPQGFLCVHAGIRPGVDLSAQSRRDMMWIRKKFHKSLADHGALVVHGHTPVKRVRLYSNRLNLDTGAAKGGPVSAVRLDEDGVWLLTSDEPKQLFPEPNR